jgi:hypothetical protein
LITRGWGLAGSSKVLRKNRCIALCREQEIDGLPCGIHGSVQISVFDPDIGFIYTVAFYWSVSGEGGNACPVPPVDLHPAPDATGVDEQTAFERHLGHVRKRDQKSQVPPHTPENDLASIVTPFEGIGRGDGHVSPYQMPMRFFATIPGILSGSHDLVRRGLTAQGDFRIHGERNHQGLDNRLILPDESHAANRGRLQCRERLGGMLNYYYRAAA